MGRRRNVNACGTALMASGELPFVQLGKRRYITRAALLALFAERETAARDVAAY